MPFTHAHRRRAGFAGRGTGFAVALLVLLMAAPQAHAGYWGESIAAAVMKQTMENIQKQIEGAVLGTLKVAATEIVNSQVDRLIGGTSVGGALFITDFNEFLNTVPQQKAQVYMNDFFTLTTRGKASTSNYIGVGDAAGSVSGNYAQYLVQLAKNATTTQATPQYNLDEFTANPETMFREGDFRAFNAFFSNQANNPIGYSLMAQAAYEGKLQTEQQQQVVMAQASGFVPQVVDGKVVTPAASIQSLSTSAQNLGNNIIAAANNPGEFLSGVVVAMVNRSVNRLIQNGVGKVQANIQREIRNVDNQVIGALNDANRTIGPAASILDEAVKQQTQVKVNTNTPPPPPPVTTPGSGT